jgi:hypothetical protein
VRLARHLLSNFANLNDDLIVQGSTISVRGAGVMGSESNLDAYRSTVLLTDGREPDELAFLLTPLVLRLQLAIIHQGTGNKETLLATAFPLDYVQGDGLDWHQRELTLWEANHHYHLLYLSNTVLPRSTSHAGVPLQLHQLPQPPQAVSELGDSIMLVCCRKSASLSSLQTQLEQGLGEAAPTMSKLLMKNNSVDHLIALSFIHK